MSVQIPKSKILMFVSLLFVCSAFAQDNVLSAKEKKEGWQLLFDGFSMNKWKGASSDSFPAKGWKVADGVLFIDNETGRQSGGDVLTTEEFENFELSIDFKLTEGANSGVKYSVQKLSQPAPGLGSVLGPEYQILDNDKHPDAKAGRNGNRKLASLYDLLPANTEKAIRPIGDWNTAGIVSKGDVVEHWLNGVKVLAYNRSNDVYNAALAQSKFKEVKEFGKNPRGYIMLQDHGNRVFFKNIKIKRL